MGMNVIQPCILVSKLKKTKTRFLRYNGYLNSIRKHILKRKRNATLSKTVVSSFSLKNSASDNVIAK